MDLRTLAVLTAVIGFAAMPVEVMSSEDVPEAMTIDRGELLYDAYCIHCHTERVHWRDYQVASNWRLLKQEVYRWQLVTGARWTDEDRTAVTRYLNHRFYHHAEDEGPSPSASYPLLGR